MSAPITWCIEAGQRVVRRWEIGGIGTILSVNPDTFMVFVDWDSGVRQWRPSEALRLVTPLEELAACWESEHMSIVQEPGICYCDCHRSGSMMIHSVPCCLGPCPVCGKHAKDERHVENCKARLDARIKLMQSGSGGC